MLTDTSLKTNRLLGRRMPHTLGGAAPIHANQWRGIIKHRSGIGEPQEIAAERCARDREELLSYSTASVLPALNGGRRY